MTIRKLTTFAAFPLFGKVILVKLMVLTAAIWLSLKLVRFNRTAAFLRYFGGNSDRTTENGPTVVGRHVNFAILFGRQFPWIGNCLSRSMALWLLLAREGIVTDLKFGSKIVNGELVAHSWLEYGGDILATDAETGRDYKPFVGSMISAGVE